MPRPERSILDRPAGRGVPTAFDEFRATACRQMTPDTAGTAVHPRARAAPHPPMQDLIVYDGKGNAVNPFTVSVNGTISTPTAIGTSTVNSDCTGTLSQTGGNYNFVVAADG